MREIKFRAWDEEEEHFFYSNDTAGDHFFEFVDGILRGFAIRPPVSSSDPMEPPEPYCDDYPVEQSTGLHWKNDILESEDGLRKYIVTYSDKQCKWWLKGIGRAWSDPEPIWSEYKYIGNIHETPVR